MIGITKRQYQEWCQTEQEQEHAAKDILQEQVDKLAHIQRALIGSIHFLSTIKDKTDRQEKVLEARKLKLIKITDSLGDLNIEVKAFNSLPQ